VSEHGFFPGRIMNAAERAAYVKQIMSEPDPVTVVPPPALPTSAELAAGWWDESAEDILRELEEFEPLPPLDPSEEGEDG
jgi:hypothetical protein